MKNNLNGNGSNDQNNVQKTSDSVAHSVFLDEKILSDARQYVRTWIAVNGVRFDTLLRARFDEDLEQRSKLLRRLLLDRESYINMYRRKIKKGIVVASEKRVEDAFLEYIDEIQKVRRDNLKAQISFDTNSSGFADVEKFIEASTGTPNTVDVYVLAHTLWLIKRKLYDRDVKNHIMPIFIGSQDGGKSTAVRSLVSPFEGFIFECSIIQITDERNHLEMAGRFVVLADEMQGMQRADVNALKRIITSPILETRLFYRQDMDKLPNLCTFIGTSNEAIEQIIKDKTGLRRFYPIQCQKRLDWNVINSLNYIGIWKAIDENNEDGYLHIVKSEVEQIQEELRPKGSAELFVKEFSLAGLNHTKEISKELLYGAYKRYCEQFGHFADSDAAFGKELKRLGIGSKRITEKKVKHTVYYVSSDADIDERNVATLCVE